jgi:hypothetical protein
VLFEQARQLVLEEQVEHPAISELQAAHTDPFSA